MVMTAPLSERADPEPRRRLLDAAYLLFSQRGIQAVGIDELISTANVAKATFYRHFPAKDDLVLAFLLERERVWTKQWVEAGARSRADTPEGQLLAIFDLFDEWFLRTDFEGCSFVNVLLEFGGRSQTPLGEASANHLGNIRSVIEGFASEAKIPDPAAFALSWHILMKGSIVQAAEGDIEAAKRAKSMGKMLIEQFRHNG